MSLNCICCENDFYNLNKLYCYIPICPNFVGNVKSTEYSQLKFRNDRFNRVRDFVDCNKHLIKIREIPESRKCFSGQYMIGYLLELCFKNHYDIDRVLEFISLYQENKMTRKMFISICKQI
jgi:hypothetical protein